MIPSDIPRDRVELVYVDGPAQVGGSSDVAAICVGGAYTKQTAGMLPASKTELVTLVDWPQGLAKTTVRQIEAVAAAKDGTHTVELALCSAFVATIFNRDFRNDVRDELARIVATVREVSRAINVRAAFNSFEFAGQTKAMQEICTVLRESGMDGVVAAAGIPPTSPAYEQAVAGLVQYADGLLVKAILPPGDARFAQHLLDVGVDRLGLGLHWKA